MCLDVRPYDMCARIPQFCGIENVWGFAEARGDEKCWLWRESISHYKENRTKKLEHREEPREHLTIALPYSQLYGDSPRSDEC